MKALLNFALAWVMILGIGYILANGDVRRHEERATREGCVVTKVEKGQSGFVLDKNGNSTFVTTPTMMEWTCKDGSTFWR